MTATDWEEFTDEELGFDEGEGEEVCAECGEMTWEPRWDDDPFCVDCWDNIFGEG